MSHSLTRATFAKLLARLTSCVVDGAGTFFGLANRHGRKASLRGRYIDPMIRVHLAAVRVDLQSNTPVLLLEEADGLGRTLPIFIGTPEATAIAYAVQGVEVPRPMTHDLLFTVIESLDATIVRIVVTALVESTYFAELHLSTPSGEQIISCRPSDAVALAVRAEAPLFVTNGLMDAEGVILAVDEDDEVEENPDELVDEFKAFLDSIHPEDFSS